MESYNCIHLRPQSGFEADKRLWIGCPSVQVTGRRVWASAFGGGKYEPSRNNYNILMYSDDGGNSWVDPYMVVTCDESRDYRGMDANLWLDPKGRLWFTMEQAHFEHGVPEPKFSDMYSENLMKFFDPDNTCWAMICENPEADEPVWSEPRYLFHGVLRNKPVVLSDGSWMFCSYKAAARNAFYEYHISRDEGKSFELKRGPNRMDGDNCPYEEPMCVELESGHLLFLVRTSTGYIAMSESFDFGKSWSKTVDTDMKNPSSRFYISKLASGRVLLVNTPRNDGRTGMRAFLSEDGKHWTHALTLDTRHSTSYPDGCQDAQGNIWVVYDCQRDNRQEPLPWDGGRSSAAKELVLTRFCEEDVIAGDFITKDARMPHWFAKALYDNRAD
ncbi:MAG: exo-alpha-sialidase [Clostridia bacterium]|nr:exo-alpha-sialidase [Clostridia bacterium]